MKQDTGKENAYSFLKRWSLENDENFKIVYRNPTSTIDMIPELAIYEFSGVDFCDFLCRSKITELRLGTTIEIKVENLRSFPSLKKA